jgi:3-hydroxyisobutyrate dehydrogenase-like beta-hydroxyacid dehydrogenase
MNIGFIGLGEMGTHIAANLVKNNFKISVYNRTLIKAKKFSKKFKCVYKSSIESLCKNKNIIILCLTTDFVVESIIDQIIKYINPGSIIIDHSTINYQVSNRIYNKAKKRKINFLDAPITGGPIGAEQGKLGIMVGGDNSAFQKTKKIMQSYSKTLEYMGASGQGQLAKISNQIVSFNIKQGLLEGLDFANRYNIKRKKLVRVLLSGSAHSYQLTKHLKSILEKTYEKKRHYSIKEIGIAIKNAKNKKLRLPCTEQIAKIIKT